MLSEGTTTRTADQLSEAQQMLGTTIGANVGGEGGSIGFTSLADKLEPALELLADMLLHPTFPAAALERIRGRTLVQLKQARDQPNSIAANVFPKVVYGDAHPYGRVTTETIGEGDHARRHRRVPRRVLSVPGARSSPSRATWIPTA